MATGSEKIPDEDMQEMHRRGYHEIRRITVLDDDGNEIGQESQVLLDVNLQTLQEYWMNVWEAPDRSVQGKT